MDWTQKAQALLMITGWYDFSLKLREDGSWYVHHKGIERREGSCLSGGCQHGSTPQEAVEQCWGWATDDRYYLVKDAGLPGRKAYKWAGFMWKEIEEAENV